MNAPGQVWTPQFFHIFTLYGERLGQSYASLTAALVDTFRVLCASKDRAGNHFEQAGLSHVSFFLFFLLYRYKLVKIHNIFSYEILVNLLKLFVPTYFMKFLYFFW